MKLTEKGQVTIPIDLRRELRLRPGDQIEIRLEVGAHAAVSRLRLLTRDARRYRTYFPTVEVIAPD
ncbi:AbrB/MazE/SpoVT family DNA-binding domain-containing protein [Saccharopolyspora shandongensis]|uniref:AbrB/MazE/SpoVT family DNA-binding domain-containing protein n=1 Tax=Saccharopolyspora shandongensis TaxID=418495 RepID=UPI0034390B72